MSEKATAKPVKPKHPGLISQVIFVTIKILLLTLLAWFLLIVWFSIISLLKDPVGALQQAESIVLLNIRFIENSPSFLAEQIASALYNFHQNLTAILNYINFPKYPLIQSCIQLLGIITEIAVSRLFIFILALPLFLLISFIGLTDGLVKRDIRKFQGARESTFTFHRMKHLHSFLFFIPLFIYLSVPVPITPTLFLTGQAILLGFVTMLSATYFKKYL